MTHTILFKMVQSDAGCLPALARQASPVRGQGGFLCSCIENCTRDQTKKPYRWLQLSERCRLGHRAHDAHVRATCSAVAIIRGPDDSGCLHRPDGLSQVACGRWHKPSGISKGTARVHAVSELVLNTSESCPMSASGSQATFLATSSRCHLC